MSNKVKTIIFGIFIILVILAAFLISLITDKNNTTVDKDSNTGLFGGDKTVEKGEENFEENLVKPDVEKDIEKLKEGKEVIGDEGGDTLSEATARNILREAKFNMARMDFIKTGEYINEEILRYDLNKNENYNKYLKSMYEDVTLISFFPEVEGYEEFNTIKQFLKDIKDKETMFLGVMSLKASTRLQIVTAGDSINPAFNGPVAIEDIKIVDHKSIPAISTVEGFVEDLKEVTEISFDIEGNKLIAYIATNSFGEHYLFKMIEKEEGKTHYITNKDWHDINAKRDGK